MKSTDCKSPTASRAVLTRGLSARAPALRKSTSSIGVIILALALGSCNWGVPYVASPTGSGTEACRYMGGPCAPDCSRFYNNGHHDEWVICMGVPYK